MKLYSPDLELAVLRTMAFTTTEKGKLVVSPRSKAASVLLASVDESYFHYDPVRVAYKRLVTVAKKRSKVLDYDELCDDPSIDEEYRDVLKTEAKNSIKTESKAERALERLNEYRRARMMYHMSKNILEELKKPTVDTAALLDGIADVHSRAIRSNDAAMPISSFGQDSEDVDEMIDEVLSTADEVLLKTGFKEFDEKNGGLPSSGVLLLAATTSGGKSAVRMNLMKQLYFLNKISVLTVSLEMNRAKENRRMASSLTQIPLWKFLKKRLTKEERIQAKKRLREFHRFGEENQCKFSLLCPNSSINISQLLMMIKPYGYKAVAIDYVSLLEGVSADNQWMVLSDIVRECKIFSEETKCLVVLLAQLDSNDDRIRYSKGMLEHSDNCWVWNYSKPEQRELKTLPVKQLKARDQELFGFDLRESFETMSVFNPDDTVPESASERDDTDSRRSSDDPLLDDDIPFDDGGAVT